jgi:hypothetical protein
LVADLYNKYTIKMAVIDAERLVKQGDANGHTESGDVMKLSLDEKFTQLWADDNSVETVVGLGDKEYR